MSTSAIAMMIVAIVLVWGSLLASVIHLTRHPDETAGDDG